MNEKNPLQQALDSRQSINVIFNGSGSEYFKIWIVNLMLSIITLGIYSAWAKVRTKRYFYGNTELDGSVFEYHATPIMILKGRLIAVTIFVAVLLSDQFFPTAQLFIFVVLALVAPWVIWRSTVFNARMASYRNVRFAFIGEVSKLYIYLLLLPLLPLLIASAMVGLNYLSSGSVSLIADPTASAAVFGSAVFAIYLLGPYIQQKLMSYYFNHHRYGQGIFQARLEPSRFYIIYLKLTGLGILITILLGSIGVLIAIFGSNLVDFEKITNYMASPRFALIFSVLLIVVIFHVAFVGKAYLQSRVRNYAYGTLTLGSGISLSSRLRAWKLFKIFTTNFFMLVFTLGLAYPWTVTRLIRYKLETIGLTAKDSLDGFVTQIQSQQSALGEEIGQAFDLNLDLGI
ncbi:YjgN family protein [Candidatus Spongiihabitans sp.]|uniref:YjgN family protein n=1 Tax=Candidatus Spongiihabitans sp. TaxID=3101308 RepID=UPI003C6EBD9B